MPNRLEPGAYWGSTRPLFREGGMAVAETAFAPDLLIPEHDHVNPFFCFVLAGHGTRAWRSRSGGEALMALTLFPAGLPHSNCWQGSGGRVLHVELEPSWLEGRGGCIDLLNRPSDFVSGAPVDLARRLAVESHIRDDVAHLAIEGLVLELLATCARAAPPTAVQPPRWLRIVQELVHDRFADRLTLQEIAATGGVSVDHMAREFRRHIGVTVGDYQRRLRLAFACDRLADGVESLSAIAFAAGFADQSHFTRSFRRQYGLTPAAYRGRATTGRFRSKDVGLVQAADEHRR